MPLIRDGLYHSDIGLPAGFRKPTGRVPLRWTQHALRARLNDRYGEIPRMQTLTLDRFNVIEVSVEDGRVVKLLLRGALDVERDLCIVLVPARGPWCVKTVWVNVRTDTHQTLDRAKYICPVRA